MTARYSQAEIQERAKTVIGLPASDPRVIELVGLLSAITFITPDGCYRKIERLAAGEWPV